MTTLDHRLADMLQWVRLREAQLETARLLRDEKRRALDSLIEAMNLRQAELKAEQRRVREIKDWTAGAHTQSMPRLLNHLHAHHDLLADNVERCEYALLDDQQRVQAAGKALEAAQAQWSQAGQRVETAKQLLSDARKRSVVATENRLERELDSSMRCTRSVMG